MGFHVANALPVGYVAFGAGPGAAASDTYKFRIIGKGGHGAYPHATIDPVVISAYFITSYRQLFQEMLNLYRVQLSLSALYTAAQKKTLLLTM